MTRKIAAIAPMYAPRLLASDVLSSVLGVVAPRDDVRVRLRTTIKNNMDSNVIADDIASPSISQL